MSFFQKIGLLINPEDHVKLAELISYESLLKYRRLSLKKLKELTFSSNLNITDYCIRISKILQQ